MIEHRFRQLGIDRGTAIDAQSIVIQPLVLAGTRMMALVPERLGRYFAGQAGIRMLDPPWSLEPLHLAMFWTPRADHDPAHRWLRERVLRAAAAPRTSPEVDMTHELNANSLPPNGLPPTTVVDHQVHWYPPSAVEMLRDRTTYPRADRGPDGGYDLWLDKGVSQPLMDRLAVDVAEHVAHATAAGVDVLVLGPATMGEVLHLPAREAADLLSHVHVAYAAAQRAHPGRLACLAALPLQEPAVALEVLDHAI
jgi:hypothetical protein